MFQHELHDTVVHRGARFKCIRIEDHERRDGEWTTLAVFIGHCADCGQPFEFKKAQFYTTMTFNKRCPAHVQPGRKVSLRKKKIQS
jgi:hypothetical protein